MGADFEFKDITRKDIELFLKSAAEAISPKSANKYRIELSALYAWAMRDGYATANIARQTEQFSITKTVKYIPPADDVARLLESSTGFDHNFLVCILHTAGRISEIREMAWEDVNLAARTLRLWTSKRRGGNRESRTIATSPTLHNTLSMMFNNRQGTGLYVFENPTTGMPYTRTEPRIKYMMKRLCEKADVQFFTAHSLRHFIATHFNDPHRAQKILGHMNLKTTEIYLHELGVDREAADIFEAITHKITHSPKQDTKKGSTFLQ